MHDPLSMNFISHSEFCLQRPQLLHDIMALKALRRVALGPDMTVLFEHPRLIWWHIQEMLRIEKGGEKQLQEEWSVYSPMLPSAQFLTLTLMIEVCDPVLRKKVLGARTGIENTLFLEGAGFRVRSEAIPIGAEVDLVQKPSNETSQGLENEQMHGVQDSDVRSGQEQGDSGVISQEEGVGDRNRQLRSPGKTSSVHFLRFPINHGVRKAFAMGEPVLSCQHPSALYRSPISASLWGALCQDLGVVPLKY
ncbi:MAG: DUF3501 family protein [Alphaproteobacteria bacterium]|nr:DUF3501 family protein [Alphaproteobacteria bacterium]